MRQMMRRVNGAFVAFGITQDDVKLDNFRVAGNKIVIMDLERMNVGLSMETAATHEKELVEDLSGRYMENRKCMEADGLLPKT